MTFAQILGQERAISSLTSALQRGQLHHAYLFGGPDGVGKELTARVLAMAANCERADGDACGECGPCKRILGRNHPDVVLVLPEAEQIARGWAGRADFSGGKASRDIKISQIRQLQERLSLKALEARRKMAIILDAEAMNPQAQNALLKTLEEPPEATTIILVSSAPNALLPTIRSRCLKLTFGPLPLEMVAERVASERKIDMATARLCAALAGGSLGGALALDPAALAKRQELLTRLEALKPGQARGALRLAEDLGSDKTGAEALLDLVEAWYRDIAVLGSGASTEGLINRDLAQLATETARRLGPTEALRRIELCRAARTTLRFNASPRLQTEQLLLRFLFRDA
jgi:DNA polymerase-3 subunit delta'